METGHVEMGEHVVPVGDDVGGACPGDGGLSGGNGGVEGGVSSCEEDKVVDLARCLQTVYKMRDGEHGVRFELDGLEGWTPVRRRRSQRKGKRLRDDEGKGIGHFRWVQGEVL